MNAAALPPLAAGATQPPATCDSAAGVHDDLVSGVRILTDSAELAEHLERIGETLAARPYLRWKPGTSCVAGLELVSGPAYALALSRAAADKLDKTVQQADARSLLLVDRHDLLLVARPPADRDLPGLRDLRAAAARLLPEPLRAPRTLAYKPQRRWVGAAGITGEPAPAYVLRAYRRQDVDRAWHSLARARRRLGPLVPEPVGRAGHLGLIAQRWSPGIGLADRLGTSDGPALLRETGRQLAALHGHRSHRAAPRLAGAPPAATAALVGALDPDLGAWASRLSRQLIVRQPEAPAEVFVHGDFSVDQVVVAASGELTFLDWDRAGTGHAAVDLATLRAAGLDSFEWEQVLHGYAEVRPLPPHLDWYLAAAIFERVPEPFRQGRCTWRAEAGLRLGQVEESLG
jgi:Phosphotransferase enzyme family